MSEREPRGAVSIHESGFTLASLLVILTVMAVVLAYSVPLMWSQIMGRERDRQTIWVMKQYARSIEEYQKKRGAPPTTLDQLKEQKNPRVIRQLFANPLSGKLDWILVRPGEVVIPGQQQPPAVKQPVGDPKDYRGPFVGVRPPQTGKSYLSLNGSESYEQWVYTVENLQMDRMQQGGGPPVLEMPTGPRR